MSTFLSKLSLNQRLALLAGVLGVGALFGNPYPGAVGRVDTRVLAMEVDQGADQIAATELAQWIIEGRADYRLLDLRDEEAYASYHIPTAELVPISTLADYDLGRDEKVLLYSNGGVRAAQAWFMLRARDFPSVTMITGGVEAWKHDVLFPSLPADASPEDAAAFETRKHVSAHFGGTPRTGSTDTAAAPAMTLPQIEMPAPTTLPTPRKKKRREGC